MIYYLNETGLLVELSYYEKAQCFIQDLAMLKFPAYKLQINYTIFV